MWEMNSKHLRPSAILWPRRQVPVEDLCRTRMEQVFYRLVAAFELDKEAAGGF